MTEKWVCNKCGYITSEKPNHKNSTCPSCKRGRFQFWKLCECGKWFHPGTTKRLYCSKECGYKYREEGRTKGKHYPHLRRARIAVCPICNTEFRAVKEYKGRESVYCSKQCWSKRSTLITKCAYCGKEIKTYKSTGKKYCGNACRNEAYKQLTGDRAAAWKGGKTAESQLRRTRVEYKEWRLAVFSRDGFKCQKCGKTGSSIEAHHIKEACNYPELIYDVDNGMTLCHECHKQTDNYSYKAKKRSRQ